MTVAVRSPATVPAVPAVPNVVLATLIFLFTEVMLFAGLVSAYLVTRSQAGTWPPLGQPRLPVEATLVGSLFLVASAATIWRVVDASPERSRRMLGWTFALGAIFVLLQGVEWLGLLRFGLTSSSSLYGSFFYAIVGCHGVHVLAALAVVGGAWGRTPGEAGLRAIRIYWIFVVAVWPPLYGLVYLW